MQVLQSLDGSDTALRDALIRGYVFLAQFVDDEEAERVSDGEAQMDTLAMEAGEMANAPSALEALRVVNRIKLEMEQAMIEACAAARIPVSAAPTLLTPKRPQ